MAVLLVIFGLGGLVFSGVLLVDGAANLARRYRVPPVVIGLTLVAFGTSLPELSVNIAAVRESKTDLLLGNILGSNIANLGLVLGAALAIRALAVESQVMRREIPLLLLVSCIVLTMGNDPLLRGTPPQIDMTEGLTLLLLFLIFVYINLSDILVNRDDDPLLRQAVAHSDALRGRKDYLFIAAGVAGLAVCGELTVRGSIDVARQFKLPESLIGLSLVAVGTSVPELVTSVVAAVRNQASLAVANVVGSNLINTMLILPIPTLVVTVPMGEGAFIDLYASLMFTAVIFGLAFATRLQLTRLHGLMLLAAYFGYIGWRYWSITASIA